MHTTCYRRIFPRNNFRSTRAGRQPSTKRQFPIHLFINDFIDLRTAFTPSHVFRSTSSMFVRWFFKSQHCRVQPSHRLLPVNWPFINSEPCRFLPHRNDFRANFLKPSWIIKFSSRFSNTSKLPRMRTCPKIDAMTISVAPEKQQSIDEAYNSVRTRQYWNLNQRASYIGTSETLSLIFFDQKKKKIGFHYVTSSVVDRIRI